MNKAGNKEDKTKRSTQNLDTERYNELYLAVRKDREQFGDQFRRELLKHYNKNRVSKDAKKKRKFVVARNDLHL
jgi:hypothetical protein